MLLVLLSAAALVHADRLLVKTQGYHTVHIGKWHLGGTPEQPEMRPNAQGFHESRYLESGLYLPQDSLDVAADQLQLPPQPASTFALRGYYGSVRHNTRAVYQHYLSWFDANPSRLDPLPRQQAATRYVR
jgi:hypothetical protein